jgi:hypothetical protein
MQLDYDRLAAALVGGCRKYIDDRIAPLVERVAAVESRPVMVPKDGVGIVDAIKDSDGVLILTLSDGSMKHTGIRDGNPGKSVSADDVAPMLATEITKAMADLPLPKEPGDRIDIKEIIEAALSRIPAPELDTEIIGEAVRSVMSAMPFVTKGDVDVAVRHAIEAMPKPQDGKSVSLDDVRPVLSEMVETAVKALPPAKDGESVTVDDVAPMISAEVDKAVAKAVDSLPDPAKWPREEIAAMVASEVKDGLAALPNVPTIDDLASLIEKAVAALPKAKDGKDADPEGIAALVVERVAPDIDAVRKLVEAIPETPELPDIPALIADSVAEVVKGLPDVIEGEVAAAIANIPAPKDGDSVTIEDVRPMIEGAVTKAVAEIPIPQDGKSVTADEMRPLLEEIVEERVAAIPVPKDGVGLAGGLIDREGRLIVTLTDGTAHELGQVVGKDADADEVAEMVRAEVAKIPIPKDGADGFGFDDLEVEHDGGRGFTLRFVQGERVKEFQFSVPVLIDRGVWRAGSYEVGDGATFGGSFWIAQEDTSDKPGTSKAWRMAVKKGRDGRDKSTRDDD